MKKTTSNLMVLTVAMLLFGCTANNQNALNGRKDNIVRNNRQLNINNNQAGNNAARNNPSLRTTTPIKHVVVIFGENVSFDHYFGTYPHAANLPGEPKFVAKPNTPLVNGLEPNALNG